MENALKTIKHNAHKARLSVEEKANIRERVVAYMRAHPAPKVSPYANIFSPVKKNIWRNNKTLPALITLGLLVGGSVSFAAEGAAPGDALYPVKIYVNEGTRGAFALTPEAGADWEVRLVERRLDELGVVTARSGATQDSIDQAQENFEKYTERVNRRIERLEQQGDKERALVVSLRLAKRIHVYEKVFARAEAEVPSVATSIQPALLSGKDIVRDTGVVTRRAHAGERVQRVRERVEQRSQELQKKFSEGQKPLRRKDF